MWKTWKTVLSTENASNYSLNDIFLGYFDMVFVFLADWKCIVSNIMEVFSTSIPFVFKYFKTLFLIKRFFFFGYSFNLFVLNKLIKFSFRDYIGKRSVVNKRMHYSLFKLRNDLIQEVTWLNNCGNVKIQYLG